MLAPKKRGENAVPGRWDGMWKDNEVGKNTGHSRNWKKLRVEATGTVRRGVAMGSDHKGP